MKNRLFIIDDLQTYAKLCLDSRMMERLSQRAQSERKGADMIFGIIMRLRISKRCLNTYSGTLCWA